MACRITPATSPASVGSAFLPVPMAQMGSYATTNALTCSALIPASPARTWPSTLSWHRPASRSSRVSPTQRIGVISFLNTALILPLTRSSVSPKYWRRSEWPTITYEQSSAVSIVAEISPVYAPFGSLCTSCAPSSKARRSEAITVWRERSAVNGGQITTSTCSASSLVTR